VKEECLISSSSGIKFKGKALDEDEELTACIESDIVLDWLTAIRGSLLVEHTFRVFSKELETTSLSDLQERISDNLPTLLSESDDSNQATINRSFTGLSIKNKSMRNSRQANRSVRSDRSNRFDRFPRQNSAFPKSPARQPRTSLSSQGAPCQLCKAKGRPQATNHGIGDCFLLSLDDRKAIIKATGVTGGETTDEEITDDGNNEEDNSYNGDDDFSTNHQ
jgi:hypothetical protein